MNYQALKIIRDRVAVAFEVAVATRKSIVLLATLLSLSMMSWQPQDSNLPAQAVFLNSGHEKSRHSRCLPERQCQLLLQAAPAVEVEVRIVEITVSNPKCSGQRLRDMMSDHSPMSD